MENESISCQICNESFKNLSTLSAHFRSKGKHTKEHPSWTDYKHNYGVRTKKQILYYCEVCNIGGLKHSTYSGHLERHGRVLQPQQTPQTPTASSSTPRHIVSPSKEKYFVFVPDQ